MAGPDLVIVDADTLAGWRRSTPSLGQLREALADLRRAVPDTTVAVVADPSLKWAVTAAEREEMDAEVADGRLVYAPAGAVGGHRGFVAQIVARAAELGLTSVVVTDQAVPGARLSRVRREGERWVFDLTGYESSVVASAPDRPRRRRSRARA